MIIWNGNSDDHAKDGSLSHFFHSNLYLSVLMEINKMKTCSRCKEKKPLELYHKNTASKDGLKAYCKVCAKMYNGNTRDRMKGKNIPYNRDVVLKKKVAEKHKRCGKCKKKKPFTEFGEAPSLATGYRSYCKTCDRDIAREKNYGITNTEFERLQVSQESKCLICKTKFSDLSKLPSVDHDHKTGVIRGLLCNQCNTLLGYAKDNIQTLLNAATYLETHQYNETIKESLPNG